MYKVLLRDTHKSKDLPIFSKLTAKTVERGKPTTVYGWIYIITQGQAEPVEYLSHAFPFDDIVSIEWSRIPAVPYLVGELPQLDKDDERYS